MPSKSDARKAANAAYKRHPKQADHPEGYTLDSRMSGKRAKIYVRTQNSDVIIAHRESADLADAWTDIAAVAGGRRKQSKRFQHAQAVTNRVRSTYPQAYITGVGRSFGGTLAQDSNGIDKQITFNKGTSLHDVPYKR
jgi:hypothetical protein